ncbi:hypothetical protein MJ904_18915 [Massilia sp. MB5]|uniref:hypothetical protein n=1 Tax=Massilia sp. MB5 TaxID=2919578 RepID=UPI001F104639|nr:hypothetical protein [Massilia sp. MB5]UMR29153.1 hypothetical protein MJ904_18915 [Massilia sp. MB5]
MTNKVNSLSEFSSLIECGEILDAVAGIMGQSPIGIKRTQSLLLEFDQLDGPLKQTVLDWAAKPLERMPVTDQRWYLEEIARHEIAHIVVAKALGFRTGEVTLVLNSRDGSHVGTSEVFLDRVTSTVEDVSTYLDRRIMVLLAGSIAESAEQSLRTSEAYNAVLGEGAASDLQKAVELIRLRLNINGDLDLAGVDRMLRVLVQKTSLAVEANFAVISVLSERFAARIKFYGERIGWAGSEIDAQPEIANIVMG